MLFKHQDGDSALVHARGVPIVSSTARMRCRNAAESRWSIDLLVFAAVGPESPLTMISFKVDPTTAASVKLQLRPSATPAFRSSSPIFSSAVLDIGRPLRTATGSVWRTHDGDS